MIVVFFRWLSWTASSDADVRGRHLLLAVVDRLPAALSGQSDVRVPAAADVVAAPNVAARLVLQERQEGHLPRRHHTQPLHLALQEQVHPLHGQVSGSRPLFCLLVLERRPNRSAPR